MPRILTTCTLVLAGLSTLSGTVAAANRDYVSVVGSSTVYPFTTTVAEQFGRASRFKTPKVESTGTGGGIKLFCGGVGIQHPDVVNASRPMKQSEIDACEKSGVRDIIEVKIGYDGIVVAGSKKGKPVDLTRRQIYLALAKRVPDPAREGVLIDNPYRRWDQIDPSLPPDPIEVLGPPPTSGTRDAFLELVMEPGCSVFGFIRALKDSDQPRFRQLCHAIREDGVYIEAGENDNLILQKLEANPRALGIFGYSFLEENISHMRGASIDGVAPTFENIAASKYPVSRPLYVYAKGAHLGVIPGLREFLMEYVSLRSMGREGYLVDKGLVPLPAEELAQVRGAVLQRLRQARR
jgi:phosphate transport system substrate-binding protein